MPVTFSNFNVMYSQDCHRSKPKEPLMIAVIKVVLTAILAGFAWLVGSYTAEYFRPYKRH